LGWAELALASVSGELVGQWGRAGRLAQRPEQGAEEHESDERDEFRQLGARVPCLVVGPYGRALAG